jgi:hypothetical protein
MDLNEQIIFRHLSSNFLDPALNGSTVYFTSPSSHNHHVGTIADGIKDMK